MNLSTLILVVAWPPGTQSLILISRSLSWSPLRFRTKAACKASQAGPGHLDYHTPFVNLWFCRNNLASPRL